MTERISSDASRNVCRRPEDEASEQVSTDKPGPTCKEPLVSRPPPDWDAIPNHADDNAALAAQNAPIGPPPPPKGAGASTNAARTSERDFGPYATAGRTHDGNNVFAGAAVAKGKLGGGFEGEKYSASIQAGLQNEVQVTGARITYAGQNVSVTVESATANVHAGIENSDGSRGLNAGAGATLGSAEMTVKHEGSSATVGISKGIGAEAHVGVRDEDADGRPELCVRVAAGIVIAGACFEAPIVIRP